MTLQRYMTRKVVFEHRNKEYRIDWNDIQDIIKDSKLNEALFLKNKEEERMAALGLMYLDAYSCQGGGAGDMQLWTNKSTDLQRKLLEPALETIANYCDKQRDRVRPLPPPPIDDD